jgi:hypothetical protein
MTQSPKSTMSDKPKILVYGGRDFEDRAAVYARLDRLHVGRPVGAMIAGSARGVDTLAVEWAKNRAIPVIFTWPIGKISAGKQAQFGTSECSSRVARRGRGIPRR